MKISIVFPGSLNALSGNFTIDTQITWDQFLCDILNNNYLYLFHENGTPHSYILVYLNGEQIDSVKKLQMYNGDSLHILSAITGG